MDEASKPALQGDFEPSLKLQFYGATVSSDTRLIPYRELDNWTLTTLQEKPITIGAKVVRYARYVVFQLAEVAVQRRLYREILRRCAVSWRSH